MSKVLTHEPRDSHVQRIAYDPESQHLYVTFTNKGDHNYVHAGVPQDVYLAMTKDPSPGKYYHNVIKRHYKMV